MLVRRSVLLALAGVLAAAGCHEVSQREPAPVLALAAFDPTVPIIPIPNDLALQGAPGVTDATRRAGLFQLIDLGGWPPDLTNAAWAPFQGIAVFVRAEAFDAAQGVYIPAAAPTQIDTATVNAQTVAIVKLDTTPPTVIPPALVAYSTANPAVGAIILRPQTAATTILAPGRYVVAVRGGENGVQVLAADGVTRIPLEADQAIALVAPNIDLSQPQNQPPGGLDPAQVEALERLRGTFAVGMDWNRIASDPICRAALGIPAAAPFPEGRCWLPPIPTPPLNQPLPTPGVTAAFAGVDLVFPHKDIASIQTFEVFTPPAPLQDEVTP